MGKRKAGEQDTADVGYAETPNDLFGGEAEPQGKAAGAQEEHLEADRETDEEAVQETVEGQEGEAESENADESKAEPDKSGVFEKPIEFDGLRFSSLEDLRKFALNAMTWREQAVHMQGKYEALREGMRSGKEPEKPQPQPTKMSREDWERDIDPAVKGLVGEGVLSQDSVDLAPDLARIAADFLVFKVAALKTFEDVIVPIIRGAEMAGIESQRAAIRHRVDSLMDELSGEDEFFEELKTPESRQKFISYLVQRIDPPVELLMSDQLRDFLADQYVAFKRGDVLRAVKEKDARGRQQQRTTKQQAVSEATGASPRRGEKGPSSDIMAFFDKSRTGA